MQLQRGFPRLSFDDPDLERSYRRSHLAKSRAQISRNLLLGIGFVIGYLMLGLSFRPALSTSLWVLVSYPIIASLAGMPASQRLVDVGVLLFTNVIGAIVCYSLERANRTNFLESYAAKERGRNCIVIMDKEYGDLTTGSFRKGSPAKAGAAH